MQSGCAVKTGGKEGGWPDPSGKTQWSLLKQHFNQVTFPTGAVQELRARILTRLFHTLILR
jgi:hypothetical protein